MCALCSALCVYWIAFSIYVCAYIDHVLVCVAVAQQSKSNSSSPLSATSHWTHSLAHSLTQSPIHAFLTLTVFTQQPIFFSLSFSLSLTLRVCVSDSLTHTTYTHVRIVLKFVLRARLSIERFYTSETNVMTKREHCLIFKSHTTLTDLHWMLRHLFESANIFKIAQFFAVQIHFSQQSRIFWLHNDNVPGNNLQWKWIVGDLATAALRPFPIGFWSASQTLWSLLRSVFFR